MLGSPAGLDPPAGISRMKKLQSPVQFNSNLQILPFFPNTPGIGLSKNLIFARSLYRSPKRACLGCFGPHTLPINVAAIGTIFNVLRNIQVKQIKSCFLSSMLFNPMRVSFNRVT